MSISYAVGGCVLVANQFSGCIDDIAHTLVDNGYARGQEMAADAAAVTILDRVGYDSHALVTMLEEMGRRLKPGGLGFARTHPSAQDRITAVNPLVPGTGPGSAPDARQDRFVSALNGI